LKNLKVEEPNDVVLVDVDEVESGTHRPEVNVIQLFSSSH